MEYCNVIKQYGSATGRTGATTFYLNPAYGFSPDSDLAVNFPTYDTANEAYEQTLVMNPELAPFLTVVCTNMTEATDYLGSGPFPFGTLLFDNAVVTNPSPGNVTVTPDMMSPTQAGIVPAGSTLARVGDNVSEFVNDANYTTLATVAALPVSTFTNDANYTTLATVAALPVSTFTNDANYTTLATVAALPVSTFTNDANYTTLATVAALPVSTFTNDANYTTLGTVLASLGGVPVSTFPNDAGYITSTNVTSITQDTGWTTNADGGDKTQVIASTAMLTALQAALNALVPGAGDAFIAVAQKVKALETALASNLLPNA
jgi:hypothetical protein